ncbi:hypothetical protein [Ruoffia tabacinasalis]|uniref:Uncharacterized protein n=1 Tax=Ruoffia tabacinasalis TaxID=87458 RepID=A0ABS0LGZ7_9LACT|nr:hypothetical protein [Ruoffia tabacinasalis]MBG9977292.1 hypothetical protein [Ruoffia tabacinasalis]
MKKIIKKSIVTATIATTILGVSLIPEINIITPNVVSAQENDILDIDAISQDLSNLYPQFNQEEIYQAVSQAARGEEMDLPTDGNEIQARAWQGVTTGQLAFAIDTAIAIATGGVISSVATKLSSSALRAVRYSIQAQLARFGAGTLGGIFIDAALYMASPGQYVADNIDAIDTVPNNGRINLW